MTNYNRALGFGDLMTVQEFLDAVECGGFIDYDGFGHPVKDDLVADEIYIQPSNRGSDIPVDATHIEWYNK